jgi:hypothetical protein
MHRYRPPVRFAFALRSGDGGLIALQACRAMALGS